MEGEELFEKILDSLPKDEFLIFDGFESAVIGVTKDKQIVYSVTKCLDVIKNGEFQKEGDLSQYEYLIKCIEDFHSENKDMDMPLPVFCFDYF